LDSSGHDLSPAFSKQLLHGSVVHHKTGENVSKEVNQVLGLDLAMLNLNLEFGNEIGLHLGDRLLARLNLGVESVVTGVRQFLNADLASYSQLVAEFHGKGQALTLKLATDASNELVVANNTVAVLIEKLEETLKFVGAQLETLLTEDPLDFVAVKSTVAVLVTLDKEGGEGTNTTIALTR
jgi:hypothetical protein